MASSRVVYNPPVRTEDIFIKQNYPSKISFKSRTSKIFSKVFKTRSIKASNFYDAKVVESKRTVKVSQKLPFYVRFENIQISGYGPSNPAPIGIAVIGFNNYIL